MEETMGIHDIFRIFRKRWKSIFVFILLIATTGAYLTYFLIPPIYQASTQILVNQKGSENVIDSAQLRSNVEIINTYSVIIKSPIILDKVRDELNLDQSLQQLDRSITVSSQNNSLVFLVAVEDTNAERAVKIANALSETFQREIKVLMNVDNVNILARAEVEETLNPVKPIPLFNMTIAIIVGVLAGIAFALVREYRDNTLKDSVDTEEILGLPVLGTIQKLPPKESTKSVRIYQKAGETIEA